MATRKTNWLRSLTVVAFSVMTGLRTTWNMVSFDMVAAFLRATRTWRTLMRLLPWRRRAGP